LQIDSILQLIGYKMKEMHIKSDILITFSLLFQQKVLILHSEMNKTKLKSKKDDNLICLQF